MKCPRCQQDNPTHARFCLGCGARLALACGSCGAELPGSARFCLRCGQAVATGTAAPVGSPAPESYTPKHLAVKILTSKGALEGERKQVTVLFADLKGSMELLADRDPEEARRLLDPVLELMMEAVHRYEGTVNQVMGDGIMALFGAPLAHEDHAVRACYAALRMQEAVRRYSDSVRRVEGISVHIRVGLNSGEVVVRAIGSDLRMDYTAVGQTTHLAARMEQLADPGAVLLTPATLALAQDFVQVKSLGPTPVKGLREAVEVYELTGANPVRSRFHAHAARGLTRFVGRTSEIARISEGLDLARSGHGQVVAVVGEPGVGKSRLFWEFAHAHRADGCLVIEAASASYGNATGYLPVIELLRGYFQIEPRDDTRKIREKLTGTLFSLDRALESALSPLLALLDVPVEDEPWSRLDPPQRRQQTLDAVKRLLLRESQVQPIIAIFEDLHWIDGETQAVLDGLVESLPAARLLLLVSYRPEYQHGWASKTYYAQIRIDPLPFGGTEELLRGLLGDDTTLDRLKRLLIERTEGNPFFLEESVRTLVETKALVGGPGGYRLATPLDAVQVPPTVQTVLAARIDRLDPETKRLLQTASVIGHEVPSSLLHAVADASDDQVQQGLGRLQAAEFLYETRLFPDLEYTFTHALTRDVAYGSLLQERRRSVHACIVDAMEKAAGDRLAEHVERLAHHALKGEVWEKALTYLRLAGTRVLARSANREAVAHFEGALVVLQRLPQSAAAIQNAIDLHLDLRACFIRLGETEHVLTHLHEAEAIATRLGARASLGWILSQLSDYFWIVADHDRAIDHGHRALALASELGDPSLEGEAGHHLGQAYHAIGDYPRAIDLLQKSLAVLERRVTSSYPDRLIFVYSRTWLLWCLADAGRFGEGIDVGADTLRFADAMGESWPLFHACFALGLVQMEKGEFGTAIAVLERGFGCCEAGQLNFGLAMLGGCLGAAYAKAGQLSRGLRLLQEAVERSTAMSFWAGQSLRLAWLAEDYLNSRQPDTAMEVGRHALELASRYKERGNESRVLHVLAEIASRDSAADSVTAERYYREASERAMKLGLRPLVAHCDFGLGKLYRRTDKRQEAQEHLATAARMYREMDMRFWLEQAEAEVKELP